MESCNSSNGGKLSELGNRVLYVRFPEKAPSLEEIRKLHPGIVNVRYPRQKSARFCNVIFNSVETATKACKKLHKKKFGSNGYLVVRDIPSKKQLKNEAAPQASGNVTECNRLWIGQLPGTTTKEQIVANFPGCTSTKLFKKSRGKKNLCSALCIFSSPKEASSILHNSAAHVLNGIPVIVQCAKHADNTSTRLKKSRKKKKKRKHSNNNDDAVEIIPILRVLANRQREKQVAVDSSSTEHGSLLRVNGGNAVTNGDYIIKVLSGSEVEDTDSDSSDDDDDDDEDDDEDDDGDEDEDESEEEEDEEDSDDVETVEISNDEDSDDDKVETVNISDEWVEVTSSDDDITNDLSIEEFEDAEAEIIEIEDSDESVTENGLDSDDSMNIDPKDIGVDDTDSEDSDDDDDSAT